MAKPKVIQIRQIQIANLRFVSAEIQTISYNYTIIDNTIIDNHHNYNLDMVVLDTLNLKTFGYHNIINKISHSSAIIYINSTHIHIML